MYYALFIMAFGNRMDVKEGLIHKVIEGDLKAFESLYLLFSKKIYATARKMRLGHEDAEEVVQELFMKIWQNRSNLDPQLSINAYILAIVKSLVIKKFREEGYLTAYKKYNLLHVAGAASKPESGIIFDDLYNHSKDIIDQLPDGQRQIFSLRYFEFLAVDEISKKLNLSKRTVENQLYRASKMVRKKMEEVDIISNLPYILLLEVLMA